MRRRSSDIWCAYNDATRRAGLSPFGRIRIYRKLNKHCLHTSPMHFISTTQLSNATGDECAVYDDRDVAAIFDSEVYARGMQGVADYKSVMK